VTDLGDVTDLLVHNVEIDGRAAMSVRIRGGLISEVRPSTAVDGAAGPSTERIDGRGAALLPGLHDHHIHLFALAARTESIWCGPPDVQSASGLSERIAEAARQQAEPGWIRAVGWDDTTSGWPDRRDLDAAVIDRPVRLQHRSGAMWVLNSAALARLRLDDGSRLPDGVELDHDGTATGRIVGLDDWLRERIGGDLPSLRDVSAELAALGVTGVTDATIHNGPTELEALTAARRCGELAQRLVVMTSGPDAVDPDLVADGALHLGPVKLGVFESDLPSVSELAGRITTAHACGRSVAVHAASRVSVVLAVAALEEASVGPSHGFADRIEHASVTPPEMLDAMARLGVSTVTQPHFIAENGDRYLATVDAGDQPWLYRGRAFLDAAVPLAAGSDAPVGGHDPWAVMAAAVDRRTEAGVVMTADERLTPEQALALFTGTAAEPGGSARVVERGAPADLCLVDRPWARAREDLGEVQVKATIIGGEVVHVAE